MRGKRIQSETDIYHIVERGTGRQLIFEDDQDRERFLSVLVKNLEQTQVELLAWCLMGNHVHLLMRAPIERIAECMRGTCGIYALGFNQRHGRTGHLFQDRYSSEPVNDDGYFLTVVRYIHQNPEKAGLARTSEWRWSSFGQYIGRPGARALCNVEFTLECFGGIGSFADAHEKPCENAGCIEADGGRSATRAMPDGDALAIAMEILGEDGVGSIGSWNRERRNAGLVALKSAGLSIRQIERLTGIGRNIVASATSRS